MPTCHRTLYAFPKLDVALRPELIKSKGSPCLGSACAMWVHKENADGTPSGSGVCADNLRATPWVDAAMPRNEDDR